MKEDVPGDEFVFVLKGVRRLGPFSVDDLLDGIESGEFSYEDVCLREGAADCERLRDVLDWDDPGDDDLDDEEWGDEDEETHEDVPPPPPPPIASVSRPPRESAASAQGADPDRPLYEGHPSVLTYPLSLLLLVGGVTGGVWLVGIDPILTLVGFGLALLGLVRLSLVRFTNDYRIGSRRIEIVTGLVARSSREVRIEDIRSINVTCRGLSGLFGIGTVDFVTTGDAPEISFARVWSAREIKALVRRLQDSE